MTNIVVSPSILSADFTDIRGAVKVIENAGAEWVHCDVMDGVFVPNMSFGQKMVGDIRKITNLILDVHLMIVNPEKFVEEFAKNGADYITIHYESTDKIADTLRLIRSLGCKAGLAIKPCTDIDVAEQYLDLIDMMLIMSVEPGFSGQKFKPETLNKMRRFAKMANGRNIIIQSDGGVNLENAQSVIDAGCTSMVAGNAFFKADDKKHIVSVLKGQK